MFLIIISSREFLLVNTLLSLKFHITTIHSIYNTYYLKYFHLSADKNLVIAKVDSTANDVPSEFNVKGFPTIYFVPAGGDKEPIVYDGAREVCTFLGYFRNAGPGPDFLISNIIVYYLHVYYIVLVKGVTLTRVM